MYTRRAFLGGLLASLAPSVLDASWLEKRYRVGVSETLFNIQENEPVNTSMTSVFEVAGKPKCQFEFGQASAIVKRLEDEHINLALFNGIEYAWLKAGYAELPPLVTAYTTDIRMRACIVVREDSKEKTLLDLKGKTILMPERLPHHAYVYLHHAIMKQGGDPKTYFKQSTTISDSNEGIESIIDEQADSILLDHDSWIGYQERKPARAKKLRVLQKSVAFPTAVILYNKNSWSRLEILMLRMGLCNAHQKPYSRQLLNFWGVSKFVPCTAKYQKAVEEILREIPDPITPCTFIAKKITLQG